MNENASLNEEEDNPNPDEKAIDKTVDKSHITNLTNMSRIEQQGTCFFLKQGRILLNLGVMSYLWAMSSMLYYFMSYYLIYLPGNTYVNTYASASAELVSVLCGGVLIKVLPAKWAFCVSNTISLIGGLLILFLG